MGKKNKNRIPGLEIPGEDIKTIRRYCRNTDCLSCQLGNNGCLVGDPKSWKYADMKLPMTREKLEEVDVQECSASLDAVKKFCEDWRAKAGCRNCPFLKDRKCMIGFPYIGWMRD